MNDSNNQANTMFEKKLNHPILDKVKLSRSAQISQFGPTACDMKVIELMRSSTPTMLLMIMIK